MSTFNFCVLVSLSFPQLQTCVFSCPVNSGHVPNTFNSAGLFCYFFKIFFFMWTILKVFIEFLAVLLLVFYVLVFWPRGMWDLSSLAAAKSSQSSPTLCDPIDGSPTGSSVPGNLQARILESVAISFSNA